MKNEDNNTYNKKILKSNRKSYKAQKIKLELMLKQKEWNKELKLKEKKFYDKDN